MSKKAKEFGIGEEVAGVESVGEAPVVAEAEPVVEAPSVLFVDEAGNEWVLTPSGEKIRL